MSPGVILVRVILSRSVPTLVQHEGNKMSPYDAPYEYELDNGLAVVILGEHFAEFAFSLFRGHLCSIVVTGDATVQRAEITTTPAV